MRRQVMFKTINPYKKGSIKTVFKVVLLIFLAIVCLLVIGIFLWFLIGKLKSSNVLQTQRGLVVLLILVVAALICLIFVIGKVIKNNKECNNSEESEEYEKSNDDSDVYEENECENKRIINPYKVDEKKKRKRKIARLITIPIIVARVVVVIYIGKDKILPFIATKAKKEEPYKPEEVIINVVSDQQNNQDQIELNICTGPAQKNG